MAGDRQTYIWEADVLEAIQEWAEIFKEVFAEAKGVVDEELINEVLTDILEEVDEETWLKQEEQEKAPAELQR